MSITHEQACALIKQKEKEEQERHLKQFAEEPELEVLNGRYGPYICYKGTNYRLPKNLHETARDLTLEQCMDIINNAPAPSEKPVRRGRYAKKS